MIILKILGGIDLIASIAFLTIIFDVVLVPLLVFCGVLLLLKSLLGLNALSILDFCSGVILILSVFFLLPIFLLWIPAFLLLAKAVVSFL